MNNHSCLCPRQTSAAEREENISCDLNDFLWIDQIDAVDKLSLAEIHAFIIPGIEFPYSLGNIPTGGSSSVPLCLPDTDF